MSTPLWVALGVLSIPVGVVGFVRLMMRMERGPKPRGEWAVVAREPTGPCAQDVVGWVAVDSRGRTGLVYCVNCAPMLHRWESWPIRRWSSGADSRCVECAMHLHRVALAKPSRGNGDKAGGLSVPPTA